MADFESACEWLTNEFNFHSIGRERGENMGKLHNQAHGACYAPATDAGCKALTQKYKEDLRILTNSRRKVQFKLLVGEQPEDKMCAYTRKWRAFQEFRYHSSDRNGDPYTDEYLAHCDDKYKVRSALHISPFLIFVCCSMSASHTPRRNTSLHAPICSNLLRHSNASGMRPTQRNMHTTYLHCARTLPK